MNFKKSLLVMNIMLALANSAYAGEQASFQLDEYVVTALVQLLLGANLSAETPAVIP